MNLLQKALKYHKLGKLARAEKLYRQLLNKKPQELDALNLLGRLLYHQDRYDEAVPYLRQAVLNCADLMLRFSPSDNPQMPQMKVAHKQFSDLYDNLVRLLAHALNNRAIEYQQQGRIRDSYEDFKESILLQPDDAELHYNFGWVKQQLDDLPSAVESYQQAIALHSYYPKAHQNLGVVLGELGDYASAIKHLQQAMGNIGDPLFAAETCYNIGNVYWAQRRLAEATDAYQQGIDIGQLGFEHLDDLVQQRLNLPPDDELFEGYKMDFAESFEQIFADTYRNLGLAFAAQDNLSDAQTAYQQALKYQPDNLLWQLERDTLAPAIIRDMARVQQWRTDFEAALQNYEPIDLAMWLDDLSKSNVKPSSYLPYHGRNDRSLKELFASLFEIKLSLKPPTKRTNSEPIRVGFVVTKGHESIFNKLVTGLLNHINDPRIEPVIVCPLMSEQFIEPYLTSDQIELFLYRHDFRVAIMAINNANFDILYFCGVGTDSISYFLPFFELAPVQCTSWGIPETTGLKQIDYYLSSDLMEMEGEQADEFYTEQLVRFSNLPVYYNRPTLPDKLKTRAELNLPEEANLYLCPQSLFKLHPEFDPLLAEILRRDPAGHLILIQGIHPRWQMVLLRRFRRNMADVMNRIKFLPRLEQPDFFNLIARCDVMLDPLHYGTNSYEGIGIGIPIVTLPTQFLKGRITQGCYRKIGVMDCVVDSREAYINMAVKLGTDSDYRANIKAKIEANSHRLFDDLNAVRELEQFFKRVAKQAG